MTPLTKQHLLLLTFAIYLLFGCAEKKERSKASSPNPSSTHPPPSSQKYDFAGSKSCKPCHLKFYQLWESSHHGTAMQPFTTEFAQNHLTFDEQQINIAGVHYSARMENGRGYIIEQKSATDANSKKIPHEPQKHPILHALGGKNVFYFLTSLPRGRLQTLPLAYDVHQKKWFDVAQSGIRHFSYTADKAVHWKDDAFTFNTSCYSCHVSQLANNYDIKTDTYHTTWREPGINCETCHGSSSAHVAVCEKASHGTIPKDLKIIGGKGDFFPQQTNDTCASCHGKLVPLSNGFTPGEPLFDHFDLVLWEHPDFYPDGRALGENYTITSWKSSPCVTDGRLDCLHCHTSSGRFRQKDNPSSACSPCHKKRVMEMAKHSRHATSNTSPTCIDCHMPMTTFAHMNRSDHSMLPPVPAATIAFDSPNACTQCHLNKPAQWADTWVTQWHGSNYKKKTLTAGEWIAKARNQDWSHLTTILAYIDGYGTSHYEEVRTASLIRLLAQCDSPQIVPTLVKATQSTSVLVRSSAIRTIEPHITKVLVPRLLQLLNDPIRLVRIRAAFALTPFAHQICQAGQNKALDRATQELIESLTSRPDNATAHYNLGNFYTRANQNDAAIEAYQLAVKRNPQLTVAWINLAMAQYEQNQKGAAVSSLQRAVSSDPQNGVAHLNMGMLLAEQGNVATARTHFQTAYEINAKSGTAAFNLCVIEASKSWRSAKPYCEAAVQAEPSNIKYAYTLAFYLAEKKNPKLAIELLFPLLQKQPDNPSIYSLLAKLYLARGKNEKAKFVYQSGIDNPQLPQSNRAAFSKQLRNL